MWKTLSLAGACLAACTATVAGAAPLDLSTFGANGSAIVAPDLIILTKDVGSQAGSAYAPAMISTASNFGISFDFTVNTAGSSFFSMPADGFSFLFQSAGATALGEQGGGIGAVGITPSAGVAFRSFVYNVSEIFQNGDVYGSSLTKPFAFLNSNTGHVTVNYDAATNRLSYDAVNSSSAAHSADSASIDLASLLGPSAYFGFTGATGGASSYQAISNVSITSAPVAAVPEAGTWAMMLVGFGGIGFAVRRRRAKTTASFA